MSEHGLLGGSAPALEEPATAPPIDPQPNPDGQEPVAPDGLEPESAELETMRKQLQKAQKDLLASQRAVAAANKEKKTLERAQMTEQETLEELRREAEEFRKESAIMLSTGKAKVILAGAGLTELEYEPILEIIATDDIEKTEAAATEIKALLEAQAKKVEKTVRDAKQKETPRPTTGSGQMLQPTGIPLVPHMRN